MKFKTKLAKKAISLLLLVAMVLTLSANVGFSAFATEQQEIDFCVDKIKNLPTDDEFLKETLKLPDENGLKKLREETVVNSDGTTEKVKISEKECYQKIQALVTSLTEKFDIQQIVNEIVNLAVDKDNPLNSETEKAQKASKFSANMQKADAIYRWVAENIHYDYESFDAIANPGKTSAKRKPQDEYFVFAEETGVCEGYARLLNLMMRMAGVPCMFVSSINGPDKNYGHAFNAVYVEEESENRKGWTLLDSCFASPNLNGDGGVKKFLSGKRYFCEYGLKNVLATEGNAYTKDLYNEFKASEDYCKNPSKGQLIEDFNGKSSEILKKLNEKHKDCAHFETIEFFDVNGRLFFKYKTDLTMDQAKQAKDRLEEIEMNREIEETVDYLKGKSKIFCTYRVLNTMVNDLKKDDFKNNTYFSTEISSNLKMIDNNDKKVENYCDELQQMYVDTVFPKLKDIEGNMDEINLGLNNKLKDLNEKYNDIITIKRLQLSVEKNDSGYAIVGNFETDISLEDIQTRARKYLNEEPDKRKKEKFAEFFPAFYKTDQSLDEANRSVVSHELHKISKISVDLMEAIFKINFVSLIGQETKAELSVGGYGNFVTQAVEYQKIDKIFNSIEKVIISNDGVKLDDKIYCRYNLSDFEKIYVSDFKNLTIEGDVMVDISHAYGLKNIDTTKSNKYHAENGILYEKVDGKKGKEIGEIFKESRDLG